MARGSWRTKKRMTSRRRRRARRRMYRKRTVKEKGEDEPDGK